MGKERFQRFKLIQEEVSLQKNKLVKINQGKKEFNFTLIPISDQVVEKYGYPKNYIIIQQAQRYNDAQLNKYAIITKIEPKNVVYEILPECIEIHDLQSINGKTIPEDQVEHLFLQIPYTQPDCRV